MKKKYLCLTGLLSLIAILLCSIALSRIDIFPGYAVTDLKGQNEKFENEYSRDDDFSDGAQHNIVMKTSAMPNDAEFLNGKQWALEKINATAAWDTSACVNSVIVAILDSGIDASHPDLTNRILRNDDHHDIFTTLHRDFTTGVVNGTPVVEPIDDKGHGTHVAERDNNIGIADSHEFVRGGDTN